MSTTSNSERLITSMFSTSVWQATRSGIEPIADSSSGIHLVLSVVMRTVTQRRQLQRRQHDRPLHAVYLIMLCCMYEIHRIIIINIIAICTRIARTHAHKHGSKILCTCMYANWIALRTADAKHIAPCVCSCVIYLWCVRMWSMHSDVRVPVVLYSNKCSGFLRDECGLFVQRSASIRRRRRRRNINTQLCVWSVGRLPLSPPPQPLVCCCYCCWCPRLGFCARDECTRASTHARSRKFARFTCVSVCVSDRSCASTKRRRWRTLRVHSDGLCVCVDVL